MHNFAIRIGFWIEKGTFSRDLFNDLKSKFKRLKYVREYSLMFLYVANNCDLNQFDKNIQESFLNHKIKYFRCAFRCNRYLLKFHSKIQRHEMSFNGQMNAKLDKIQQVM